MNILDDLRAEWIAIRKSLNRLGTTLADRSAVAAGKPCRDHREKRC